MRILLLANDDVTVYQFDGSDTSIGFNGKLLKTIASCNLYGWTAFMMSRSCTTLGMTLVLDLNLS